MKRLLLILVSAVAGLSVSAAAGRITFDDLYSMPRASDPQISPDGRRILFVLLERDAVAETGVEHIWVMNSDGSGLRQLTRGEAGESHPRWSPDGRTIVFESSRSGTDQIWVLPIDGGEASPVTRLHMGATGAEWSPSGGRLIFSSSVYPGCETDSCNTSRDRAAESNPLKARLYDKLMYRHYNRWSDSLVDQLFLLEMSDFSYRNIYPSGYNVPTVWLGGNTDYAISPDGSEVCFSISMDSTPALCINNDLMTVGLTGKEPTSITDFEGLEVSPSYSPDGRYISYHAQARACYESDQNDLVLYDRESGTHQNLTESFDRSIGGYVWGPDSRTIYFTAIDAGKSKVYQIDVKWGKTALLLDDAVYDDLAVSPDGKYLVVGRSLADEPYELFKYDIKRETLTRLTFFTDDIVSDLDLSPYEDFWFTGFNGDSVHGYLTYPPFMERGKKYPLVLLIHGGPQWCWLGDFNYYGWNTQLVAAQGYAVAQIDPHGSVGYGLEFKEYVSGNWGRGDYEDLMLGIDYLVKTYSLIDSSRMAALGRSYGGFMVNWICGHTDRFKCLIGIDGSSNEVSSYGTTEELWFPEWELSGTPWSNPDEYHRASPLTYAVDFKTPTMLIHGQKDYRVDLSEGLQMFTALQRMGIPSQLLYFPDEGHNARKIGNLRYAYEKQFDWLRRWLYKGEPVPSAAD